MTIIELIRTNLGYAPLQKIDPNKHEVKDEVNVSAREKLAQAAIPGVLIFLFKYILNDKGYKTILANDFPKGKLDTIFENKKKEAVSRIAQYAGISEQETAAEMEKITDVSISEVLKETGSDPTPEKMRSYLSSQRHTILTHLPAALQLGSLLQDDSLDDRTNKMEGPVSNTMHFIENLFSGSSTKKAVM
jgi:hypothetical protein